MPFATVPKVADSAPLTLENRSSPNWKHEKTVINLFQTENISRVTGGTL